MPKISYKVSKFIQNEKNRDRSAQELLKWGMPPGSVNTDSVKYSPQEYFDRGVESIKNLVQQEGQMPVDPIQSESFNYFSLLSKIDAPVDLVKIMANVCLKEQGDRKSTRLNSSHIPLSRMPSSA